MHVHIQTCLFQDYEFNVLENFDAPIHSVERVKQAIVDLDKHLLFLKGEGIFINIVVCISKCIYMYMYMYLIPHTV
jgi:hypothetical protein